MNALTASKFVARLLWFRPGKIRRALAGPYRGLNFEITPQIDVSRLQIFYRAYEPEVTAALRRTLIAPMIVFDVGAHVGIHALYAARLLRDRGTVYAFEPWPQNFIGLERNIAINGIRVGRVVAIRKSVGKRDGEALMVEGASDGTHHLAQNTGATGQSVAMTTLDSAAVELKASPDLIIVDVEGGELQVLEGGTAIIADKHPVFILEHHGDERRRELSAWLAARGYQISEISDRHILAQFPPHSN